MNAFLKAFTPACLLLFSGAHVMAQNDTIIISAKQAEELFLQQNLQLIAERLNIDKAEADILQAKLWPNPTFTVDQVNLWSTDAQRQGTDEVIPPLTGSFGKNLEFGIGIEQLLLMGGKRRKLTDREKVSKEIAGQYFEELLCALKVELRNTCTELCYFQQYLDVLLRQEHLLNSLTDNYRQQTAQGAIAQSQLLRLQGAMLSVESEANEVRKEIRLREKNLRVMLAISSPIHIYLTEEEETPPPPDLFSYASLAEKTASTRPDLKRYTLQSDYYEKSIRYEKSLRVPDLTLHAAYDRGGNCMLNFVGVGFSMDLPFFNRNQGAIKVAEAEHRQSLIETKQMEISAHNEVSQALENYRTAYLFYQRIHEKFSGSLEDIQEGYMHNFLEQQIGIVEFMDFFDSYKESKRSVLTAWCELLKCFEELQYAVGTELTSIQ